MYEQLIKTADGGVCAAKGFKANGLHCGIRPNTVKKDLAMIVSSERASAAAVYTTNLVKGAPLAVTKEHLQDGAAQAVIVNSGNANTCNADGIEIARAMCGLVEDTVGIASDDVIVASTGVIGQPLSLVPIAGKMKELADGLSETGGRDAAEAIMTTDTFAKEAAVSFECGGVACRLGGIAKGSGMIHPNMATMLVFLTTDAAISPEMLKKALADDIPDTFNMISIDGDTSTNDMVSIMANGAAGNPLIEGPGQDYDIFYEALHTVMSALCRMLARDGEGATKLLECAVTGAKDKENAKTVAKSVICSSLVKSAMYGSDANWGRILCAIGYSGADVDVNKVEVSFVSDGGSVLVCKNGAGVAFSEELAKEVLACDEIRIMIDLHDGDGQSTAWGCDLTHEYVTINADYRT